MRKAEIKRKTRETEITIKINLDGEGEADIETGVAFLDHMMTSLATHSLIDITARVKGDLKHHIVEDVSICLGEALKKALDKERGIQRFGHAIVPMDCSIAICAVDLAKRPYSKINLLLERKDVEKMPAEDIYHFLETLSSSLKANIHIWVQYGSNDHHKVEAAFKALALSLRRAVALDPRRNDIPSSKGVI